MTNGSQILAEAPEEIVDRPDHLVLLNWWERFGVIAGISSGPTDYVLAGGSHEWSRLSSRLAPFSFSSTTVSRQVHGVKVARAEGAAGLNTRDGLDGHLTATPGALLGLTVADCVPVYLVAPASGHLALLHAGWRGTASGILESAVERLGDEGVPASALVVHLGVSICGRCYEVGREVFEALGLAPVEDRHPVDLRAALADRAQAAGVKEVSMSPWCTLEDRRFHSFRRDGVRSGRMAAFLGWPSP